MTHIRTNSKSCKWGRHNLTPPNGFRQKASFIATQQDHSTLSCIGIGLMPNTPQRYSRTGYPASAFLTARKSRQTKRFSIGLRRR
jgi:hypothetical protein